jgi:hypothetical protein
VGTAAAPAAAVAAAAASRTQRRTCWARTRVCGGRAASRLYHPGAQRSCPTATCITHVDTRTAVVCAERGCACVTPSPLLYAIVSTGPRQYIWRGGFWLFGRQNEGENNKGNVRSLPRHYTNSGALCAIAVLHQKHECNVLCETRVRAAGAHLTPYCTRLGDDEPRGAAAELGALEVQHQHQLQLCTLKFKARVYTR